MTSAVITTASQREAELRKIQAENRELRAELDEWEEKFGQKVTNAHQESLQVVENWHNETHAYAFRFCDQQPCHALNRPGA